MQRHSLLDQQKRAAARSAHCHDLARLRTLQGCLGTAKFYQFEAARLHVRACELRDQMACVQPLPGLRILNVVIDDKAAVPQEYDLVSNGRHTFKVARYVPPANPAQIEYITGSKPWPHPMPLLALLG